MAQPRRLTRPATERNPDFFKLSHFETWLAAAGQISALLGIRPSFLNKNVC
jgi:hypothetical protein